VFKPVRVRVMAYPVNCPNSHHPSQIR